MRREPAAPAGDVDSGRSVSRYRATAATLARMQRRALQFNNFAELKADLNRLRGVSYQRAGSWSLAQVCEHMARVMTMSMDGFGDMRVPWYIRVAGPLMKRVVLKRGKMPAGVRGPKEMMPADSTADDGRQLDDFLAAIERYERFDQPLQPSPLFGPTTREEWDRVHLIHAAHHLSFIVPD